MARATAHWAPEGEFDWDHLIVVIPDLHLMTAANGKSFRDEFVLDPELDLLHFAWQLENLTALTGKLKIIQIGDSYDLWVGREPRLWKERNDVKMELIAPPDQRWGCGKMGCAGHPQKTESCPNRLWSCGRAIPPCYGHEINGGESYPCPTKDYRGHPTAWDCGRAWPECPWNHTAPQQFCSDEWTNPGMLWKCRKLVPLCPGHAKPGDACPDMEEGDAVAWIRSWIGQIQGKGAWVESLLTNRFRERPERLESLKAMLTRGGEEPVWLNPAELAFRLMAQDLQFLYGNHDNYLDPDIIGDIAGDIIAGLPAREHVIEVGRVFVEHGHRLEATLFGMSKFRNEDGAKTGYESTMSVYKNRERMTTMTERGQKPIAVAEDLVDWLGEIFGSVGDKDPWVKPGFEGVAWLESMADKGAMRAQQPQYWGEYARVWLGRASLKEQGKMPPHVFVIGHTHCPTMSYIDIVFDVV